MKVFRDVKEGECFFYKDKLYCRTPPVEWRQWDKNGVSHHSYYNCFNMDTGTLDCLRELNSDFTAYSFEVEPVNITEVVTEKPF